MNLGRKLPSLKSGEERLRSNGTFLPTRLLDFWRWSVSDLLSNATRGVLAEFLVAVGLGCDTRTPRNEWDKFDLTTPEGVKVEVKSAAYLQSWNQPSGLSKISFSIKEALPWDADSNKQGTTKGRSADVYVFCLLHHTDKDTVDPLDLDQWTFFVRSIRELDRYTRSRSSITLKSLQAITPTLKFDQLDEEVRAAHSRP